MNAAQPVSVPDGEYAKQFPADTPADRGYARDVMRRQGCKSIRFVMAGERMVAHGYVARIEGPGVEPL